MKCELCSRVSSYLYKRKENLDSASTISSHCVIGDWYRKATPPHSSTVQFQASALTFK